jgi:hypothetical protein
MSGGPKTAGGKLIASKNALAHGLRSASPVIPGESAEAWHTHRLAVFEDLAPVGAVEELLADRIASIAWRIRRVERFETARLTQGLEHAEDDAAKKHGHTTRAAAEALKRILEGATEALDAL